MNTDQPCPQKESYYCINCEVYMSTSQEQKQHYKSEFHRYNLKRRLVNLLPFSQEQYDQQLNTISNISLGQSQAKFNCELCTKQFSSSQTYQQHIKSKKHQQNSKKIKSFPQSKQSNETTHYKLTTMDNQSICLFCNKPNDTIEQNLEHMKTEHSFFIFEKDHLTDLPGLLKYLREKIHVGLLCIFCENRKTKQFQTGEAVQMHMINQGHCFMQTKAINEYQQFYDLTAVKSINCNGKLIFKNIFQVTFESDEDTSQFEIIEEQEDNNSEEWDNIETKQQPFMDHIKSESMSQREMFIMQMNLNKYFKNIDHQNNTLKLATNGELILPTFFKKLIGHRAYRQYYKQYYRQIQKSRSRRLSSMSLSSASESIILSFKAQELQKIFTQPFYHQKANRRFANVEKKQKKKIEEKIENVNNYVEYFVPKH